MEYLLNIFKIHLDFIYRFFKLFKTNNNKIVFISRRFNKTSLDFELLKEELLKKDNNLEIKILCNKIGKSIFSKIGYYFTIIHQMYHLATSKVCVVDSYIIPVSILKHKKELTIFQIWHASAAIKQFGYQTLDKEYGRSKKISDILQMHNNYDVILSGSKEMIKYFAKAYKQSEDKFITLNLPSFDYILNNKDKIKDKILKDYPDIIDKELILYAPTFRVKEAVLYDTIINSVDYSKYNLIVKAHPSKKTKIKDERIYKCKYSADELLTIADHVITDYSSISILASKLNKKLYFYVYDYDAYKKKNGLNIDLYKEIPSYVFNNTTDLINKLQTKYDFSELKKFRDKYNNNVTDGTKKLASCILTYQKGVVSYEDKKEA